MTVLEELDLAFQEVGSQIKSARLLSIKNSKPTSATLFASLAAFRDIRVIPIVVVGSSVAERITPDRWVYVFNKRVQLAYPKSVGTEQDIRTLSTAVTTAPSGTGAVLINAAVGSATSSSYLTATTRPQIMNLKPAVIIHGDMPANDYSTGVAPATVKLNIINHISDMIAKEVVGYPCQHVIIGGYYPTVASPVAPINDYRLAMQDVAAEFPGKVSFVDTYEDWIQLGVGSGLSDPLDLLMADNLHPNEAGHKVLADTVARVFALPDGKAAGGGYSEPSLTPLTSDGYSGSGTMSNRSADLALGGTAKSWIVGAGSWSVASGVMSPSTATGSGAVLINMGVTDNVQVSSVLNSWTSGVGYYLELFRTTSSTNAFLLGFNPTGVLVLSQSSTGEIKAFPDSQASIIGKRLGLRYFQGKLSVWINDVKRFEIEAQSSGGFYAGYSKTAGTVTLSWDEFLIQTLI